MPMMDGFTVMEELRQREQATGAHLPAIALTALSMSGDRERCLTAGMDDYLAKPIRVVEFDETINRVMKRYPPARAADPELIDARTLLAACGGDPSLLARLTSSFETHSPRHLAQLRDAIEQRNFTEVRQAAHKLRGLVSSFSTAGADAVALVEQSATDEDFPNADEHSAHVAIMVRKVSSQLPFWTVDRLKQHVRNQ